MPTDHSSCPTVLLFHEVVHAGQGTLGLCVRMDLCIVVKCEAQAGWAGSFNGLHGTLGKVFILLCLQPDGRQTCLFSILGTDHKTQC